MSAKCGKNKPAYKHRFYLVFYNRYKKERERGKEN